MFALLVRLCFLQLRGLVELVVYVLFVVVVLVLVVHVCVIYLVGWSKKWRMGVSIPLPLACKASALPCELIPRH